MKYLTCVYLLLTALTMTAFAVEIPPEVEEALPDSAEMWMEEIQKSDGAELTQGIAAIADKAAEDAGRVFRERLQGAVGILLIAVLCAGCKVASDHNGGFLQMTGALSITALTVGSLDHLIGMGSETIQELSSFSRVLLPSLAAATAAAGGISTASVQQIAAVFFADLLVTVIRNILLPLVYFYIGILTAGTCLPESHLDRVAEGLKKGISKILTGGLLLFTGYLSAARVIAGTADQTSVKVAKAALKGVIPVVGDIISEAAETVLAGTGVLRNTIGVFGMLGVLAACAYPFLQLGIQYILYKAAGFLSSLVGDSGLCRLIDGLGGAFGLILGMVGSCALLLLISILSAVSAVIPS